MQPLIYACFPHLLKIPQLCQLDATLATQKAEAGLGVGEVGDFVLEPVSQNGLEDPFPSG